MSKPKNIPYRLDEGKHKQLKMFCVEHGISMQQFLERAMEEHMKKWAV